MLKKRTHDMKIDVEMACETKQTVHGVFSSGLASVYLCPALQDLHSFSNMVTMKTNKTAYKT